MNETAKNLDSPSPSDHYLGASGAKYFEWQEEMGKLTGELEAPKFRSYISRDHHVLDFGCGGGYVLRSLECSRRVGVEVNPAARTCAEMLGIECYDSLHKVDDDSFDVIISNHALEHVPFPIEVLRTARRKLKPSGTLVLCVPIDDWRAQRKYNAGDINHHLNTWTPQLLGNSLVEAGFKPSEFSIRILSHAWFGRIARVRERIPKPLFDFLCYLCAVVIKRRQLIAVAKRTSEI
jgi:SAM-dependent methyltransferase